MVLVSVFRPSRARVEELRSRVVICNRFWIVHGLGFRGVVEATLRVAVRRRGLSFSVLWGSFIVYAVLSSPTRLNLPHARYSSS